jgi:hypothetical protein
MPMQVNSALRGADSSANLVGLWVESIDCCLHCVSAIGALLVLPRYGFVAGVLGYARWFLVGERAGILQRRALRVGRCGRGWHSRHCLGE